MITSLICASHSPLLYCYAREPEDWDGLQRAFAERAQAVSEFDPELVVAFGSDHFNGFFLKTMPAFCVGINAEAAGDIGGFAGPVSVPEETAVACVEYLRNNDIDSAVSYEMTIDHAFSQTINVMLGSLTAPPDHPCLHQLYHDAIRALQAHPHVGGGNRPVCPYTGQEGAVSCLRRHVTPPHPVLSGAWHGRAGS